MLCIARLLSVGAVTDGTATTAAPLFAALNNSIFPPTQTPMKSFLRKTLNTCTAAAGSSRRNATIVSANPGPRTYPGACKLVYTRKARREKNAVRRSENDPSTTACPHTLHSHVKLNANKSPSTDSSHVLAAMTQQVDIKMEHAAATHPMNATVRVMKLQLAARMAQTMNARTACTANKRAHWHSESGDG